MKRGKEEGGKWKTVIKRIDFPLSCQQHLQSLASSVLILSRAVGDGNGSYRIIRLLAVLRGMLRGNQRTGTSEFRWPHRGQPVMPRTDSLAPHSPPPPKLKNDQAPNARGAAVGKVSPQSSLLFSERKEKIKKDLAQGGQCRELPVLPRRVPGSVIDQCLSCSGSPAKRCSGYCAHFTDDKPRLREVQ